MEEQQTTPPQQPKGEKKSKKKPIIVDEAKIKEAKRKVNDHLQGTGLEEPETFVPPTVDSSADNTLIKNDNSTAWLSDQVAALSGQVEMLETTNAQLKSDNAKLMNVLNGGGTLASTGDLSASEKTKILELYKYFEGIYSGRNQMRIPFDTAKFSNPSHGTGILDMFLNTFIFLQEHKQYQHRG